RVAQAAIAKAEADLDRWKAEETFRSMEYERFRELNKADSVQRALVDEKLFQLESVRAGLRASEASVLTSQEQAVAAAAQVELADADLSVAQAQAQIAESLLKKAQLYVSFGTIRSPYDGVVTARHYHLGEFIRDADKGGLDPL